MKKMNNKGFEMPFSWVFSIIAGSVIILLAIYGASRFVQVASYSEYSESAKSLANLLNPVVNDMTVATKAPDVVFKKDTRVYLYCQESSQRSPIFGRQVIAFSEEFGFLGKKWTEPGANISRYNKYIFGENVMEGKKLYIFSKPFYMGYRVDDLVMLTTQNYCFVNPPDSIEIEIENMKPSLKHINASSRIDLCKEDTVKVCFGFTSGECNISISEDNNGFLTGRVSKNGTSLEYAGNLLWAAIFSSPEIYQCNIKRLGAKTSELGTIYKEKIDILSTKNCNSLITPYINRMISISASLTMSSLDLLYNEAKAMDEKNCAAIDCRIYAPESC